MPTAMRFIFLILLMSMAAFTVHAKEFKIAVIKSDAALPYDEVMAGFKSELQRDDIIFSFLDGSNNRSQLAERVAAIQPAIILCLGARALDSISDIHHIPKVYCLVTLSKTYTYANRKNIYGVTIDISPVMQFKLIKKMSPNAKQIGVIYDPDHNWKLIENMKMSASAAGMKLIAEPVNSIKEIPAALHNLIGNVDYLWSIYDQMVYGPETAKYILLYSLRKNIPLIGFSPQFARAGALVSFYGDYKDMGRQAAIITTKILDGEEPAFNRIEPRKIRIAINEKVAKSLGISFPDQFLRMVDKTF